MNDLSHLVERAAERLRASGALDASTASLLAPDKSRPPQERPSEPPPEPMSRAPMPQPFAVPAPTPAGDAGAGPPPPPESCADVAEPAIAAAPVADAEAPSKLRSRLFRNPAPIAVTAAVTPPADGARALARRGLIPLDALRAAGMADGSRARSRLSEELRLVQSQILHAAFSPEPGQHGPGHGNIVMVTSARPGEGKSFTALNLAASIARQRDREVILVDVDGRAGSLSEKLGVSSARGLQNLAANPSIDPISLLLRTELEKLAILPLGMAMDPAGDGFSARPMTRAVRDLGRRFADRVVILDAAACLSTSDPSLFANIVGQVVMLVEAERTQRAEVEAALDLVQACPTIVMLLNKVQAVQRNTFGGYASTARG